MLYKQLLTNCRIAVTLSNKMFWLVKALESRIIADYEAGMDLRDRHSFYFHWLAEELELYDDDNLAPTWLSAVVSSSLNETMDAFGINN